MVNNKIDTLILSKDDKIYEIKTNLDATKLNSKEITKIKFDIELPDGIETGNWNVYLRISQYGNIKNDNNYLCIRFANNGDIWNKTLGANYIGKINIQEKENIANNETESDGNNNLNNDILNEVTNNINDNTQNKVDNTISKNSYPKTGKNSILMTGIGLILIIISWMILYKKK